MEGASLRNIKFGRFQSTLAAAKKKKERKKNKKNDNVALVRTPSDRVSREMSAQVAA